MKIARCFGLEERGRAILGEGGKDRLSTVPRVVKKGTQGCRIRSFVPAKDRRTALITQQARKDQGKSRFAGKYQSSMIKDY